MRVSGDGVFFSAGKKADAYKLAGAARNKVAADLDLIPEGTFKFCWVVDYPMYEWDEDNKKIDFSHNPFSMPQAPKGKTAMQAGMINAFKFGAPPHGGIAPGVDRIVMLLAGTNTIRDVILFPMNGQAQDLMMNAPAEVDQKALKELHLKLVPPTPKD